MDIKKAIEKQLTNLLKDAAEPSEGRMKLLKLGIAYLAVNAKLEENEYGDFFKDPDESGAPSGVPQRQDGAEPDTRRRKKRSNGAEEPARGIGEGIGAAGEGT